MDECARCDFCIRAGGGLYCVLYRETTGEHDCCHDFQNVTFLIDGDDKVVTDG